MAQFIKVEVDVLMSYADKSGSAQGTAVGFSARVPLVAALRAGLQNVLNAFPVDRQPHHLTSLL
jgi:hypothetical protein